MGSGLENGRGIREWRNLVGASSGEVRELRMKSFQCSSAIVTVSSSDSPFLPKYAKMLPDQYRLSPAVVCQSLSLS